MKRVEMSQYAAVVMIKTLLYTGVRVTELVHIKLSDIDFDRCQIRVNQGKGKKESNSSVSKWD